LNVYPAWLCAGTNNKSGSVEFALQNHRRVDPMALAGQFLTEVRRFLKTRDGNRLGQWLQVEPPVPDHYHKLAQELRGVVSIETLVEQHLPEEDDVPTDQGTAWRGFIAFMADYLKYWRDVDFEDLLGAHDLLMGLTK
jgi:hypothetical protein